MRIRLTVLAVIHNFIRIMMLMIKYLLLSMKFVFEKRLDCAELPNKKD